MYLIVGLGNPGEEYQNTRHNLGFRVIDGLREKLSAPAFGRDSKSHALISSVTFESTKLLLAKPETFMNASGLAVKALQKRFKVALNHIIVVHDESDLAFGEIKISMGRGAAGHRGITSLIEALGSKNFIRIRLGIRPHSDIRIPAGELVLKKFSREEKKLLPGFIEQTCNLVIQRL